MSRYEEGIKLIEEGCGNGKDNVISLSTIAMEPNAEGKPSPCVREVDAHYEDGVFYVTTWAKSNKMQQIAQCHQCKHFPITLYQLREELRTESSEYLLQHIH